MPSNIIVVIIRRRRRRCHKGRQTHQVWRVELLYFGQSYQFVMYAVNEDGLLAAAELKRRNAQGDDNADDATRVLHPLYANAMRSADGIIGSLLVDSF